MENNVCEKWIELFGNSWDKLVQINPNVGAFLLAHKNKTAYTDVNSVRLLAAEPEPDYSELSDILSRLEDFLNERSPIMLEYVLKNDDYTAGYIYVNSDRSAAAEENLSLCSQAELVSQMQSNDGKGTVMLIGIDGIDGDIAEHSCCIFSALGALFSALPHNAAVSEHSDDKFWIYLPEIHGDPADYAKTLQNAVEKCRLTDRFGTLISEHHSLTISAGICSEDIIPVYKLHSASFALYDAQAHGRGSIEIFKHEKFERRKAEYDRLIKFSRLVDENLFTYHFQPIVSAATGNIVAYEALMRTDPSIGFNPIEVLELAQRYNRLYDIELATMRNTFACLSENQSFFENRKLFINSIPSELLTQADYLTLRADFGELTEKAVIELTEHTEISDEELSKIKKRIAECNMQLAIDDYGTGYSNTSNLVRYAPAFVKLDRSLIADIDRKPKMQALVSGIIDFIHSNGYSALAEGVETIEEVRTMIGLSVDLLQGYYVSRPKPVFVNEISESIRANIIRINLEAVSAIHKTYHADDGCELDLAGLKLEKYTDIFIEGGRVKIIGDPDHVIKMPIAIKENSSCELVLHGTKLEAESDAPLIKLENNCSLKVICEGDNEFFKGGIYVPEDADLQLLGTGSLKINAESQNCYGIGNVTTGSFGNITLSMDGLVDISVNGENGVAIGGGKNGRVKIEAGTIIVGMTSINCVAVGCFTDKAYINISNCAMKLKASAANAVCIGSLGGDADISVESSEVDCKLAGSSLCAVGSLKDDAFAKINMHDFRVITETRGRNIVNIGTFSGVTNCRIENAFISIYSEGGVVVGIGSKSGGGSVYLSDCETNITFLTGDGLAIGSPDGTTELVNIVKHIRINE